MLRAAEEEEGEQALFFESTKGGMRLRNLNCKAFVFLPTKVLVGILIPAQRGLKLFWDQLLVFGPVYLPLFGLDNNIQKTKYTLELLSL